MTKVEMNNEIRTRMAQIALDAYAAAGYEVLQTAGGTWYIPCLDQNGDESWFKFSAIVPSKVDEEEGTDGYSLAQEFNQKQAAKAAKKVATEEKKAKDQARRAAKKTK